MFRGNRQVARGDSVLHIIEAFQTQKTRGDSRFNNHSREMNAYRNISQYLLFTKTKLFYRFSLCFSVLSVLNLMFSTPYYMKDKTGAMHYVVLISMWICNVYFSFELFMLVISFH